MSRAEQDRYFAEAAVVARMLGADPVPETSMAAERLIRDFRDELGTSDRSREFRDLVIKVEPGSLGETAVHKLLMGAAIDLLPGWARGMHGLTVLPFTAPPIRAATFGLASTLRWAFAREAYR